MKSRFFCVAVEGATTDGRVIEASWLTEMASNYNPATYGARVNCEHVRGYSGEPPFNAYGDVLALEVRDIEIELNGKKETKKALFAQIDANDQLIALNKKGQKLYTSIEVNPNFAGKGQAYLMALAVTDSPASLGTEMLEFAAKATVNPFSSRKQHADNLFSATDANAPIELVFEDGQDLTGGQSFSLNTILAAAAKKFGLKAADEATTTIVVPAAGAQPDIAGAFADLSQGLQTFNEQIERERAADRAAFGQLQSDFNALKAKLEAEPNPNHNHRQLATGGAGGVVTDC